MPLLVSDHRLLVVISFRPRRRCASSKSLYSFGCHSILHLDWQMVQHYAGIGSSFAANKKHPILKPNNYYMTSDTD